jgi:23S rRNA pseudouridine1911/1915/1917 synthase
MDFMQSIIAKPDDSPDDANDGSAGVWWIDAAGAAGDRVDRFLAQCLPGILPAAYGGLSRTRIQRWIALGAVRCAGRMLMPATRLTGIETIEVEPQPREADSAFVPEPVELRVLWRDDALFVIDKPPGLVVHPAAGNWHGTLLNGLLHLDPSLAALPRAGIVHRLDKDTSGLLAVARTEAAMMSLASQLADRSMGRRYLALASGAVAASGTIDAPIGRDERSRVRMAVTEPGRGRESRTHFRCVATGSLDGRMVSLLECRLETGRTHQIRVHLASIGHPLAGDLLYGGRLLASFSRQALHAWRLDLVHPSTGVLCGWESPVPADLHALLGLAGIDPAATGFAVGTVIGDTAAAGAGRG